MSTVIQIKRSSNTSAPATLKLGEMAYTFGTGTQSNLGDRLFIGEGGVDGNGDANNITVIGGQYFADKLDHVDGTLTASSALTADSNSAISAINIGNSATVGGTLKFNEGTNNGSNFVSLKAPNAIGSNLALTLPSSDGSDGHVLTTDGSGNLSFAAPATTLTLVDESSTSTSINLLTETLKITGGNGIATSLSGDTMTVAFDNDAVFNGIDMNGTELFLDADKDTSITADTDDKIDIKLGGNDRIELSTGLIGIKNDGSQSQLRLYCESSNAHYAALQAPAHADFSGNHIVTLPSTAGTLQLAESSVDLNGNDLVFDADADTKLVASSDDVLQMSFAGVTGSPIEFGAGYISLKNQGSQSYIRFYCESSNAHYVQLQAPAHADFSGNHTMVLPNTAGTLIGTGDSNTVSNAMIANSSITIGSDAINLGATRTDINGLTSLDVDNITVDGNTISTTNTNGDLVLDPNGSGDIDVNSSKIVNVSSPTADSDAATKAYVDGVANGLDVKESCRVATTANLASSYNNGLGTLTASGNGALTVDGVTMATNDRILVKNQTSAVQNGIYKVTNTGGASAQFVLTRTPDADTAAELTGGTFFFVEEGTANSDNGYVATHNGTPTFGSTNISFDQFSGAGQISAGDALTKSGNTLNVAVDDSSIEVNSDALRVKASGITNAMLAGSIATSKLSGATISFSDDSSTVSNVTLGETFAVAGGEGVDATISGQTLTIAGELATTSNKGVASFSSDNFAVSSGAVTVTTIDGGTF